MPEVFSWREGTVSVFTGAAATSAVVAYAENTNLSLVWGWDNRPAAGGNYYDQLTGLRADFTVGALVTSDETIQRIAQSATAVHIKYHQTSFSTGGYWLYSGRIDRLQFQGQQGGLFSYSLVAHFNIWSGY